MSSFQECPYYRGSSVVIPPPSSLLSHSAVVARELGLPTIVGVSGGLMKRLKTGMRVHMDASKGRVTILRDEEGERLEEDEREEEGGREEEEKEEN